MAYNKEAAKDRKKGTALLPAAGFILIVVLGAVSWFIAPSLQGVLLTRMGANLNGQQGQMVVALGIFIVLVMFVGLIYAVAVPRNRDDVKDADILKDKKEITRGIEERKARRRKMKHEMRK